MTDLNLDAESITRNKKYGSLEHLQHLLKIGWIPESQLIKKFLAVNNLSKSDLDSVLGKINESSSKECCIERN